MTKLQSGDLFFNILIRFRLLYRTCGSIVSLCAHSTLSAIAKRIDVPLLEKRRRFQPKPSHAIYILYFLSALIEEKNRLYQWRFQDRQTDRFP